MSGSVKACVACVIAMAAGVAEGDPPAADRPWHVGAEIGRGDVDESADGLDIDDSTTTYRLSTGFRFLPWLGIEGAYTGLGTAEADAPGFPAVEADADGFELSLAGHVPVGRRFGLYGRVGRLWWNSEFDVAGVRDDDSGNDLLYAAGAEFALSDWLVATGGWAHYEVDDIDVEGFAIGARIRFGEIE